MLHTEEKHKNLLKIGGIGSIVAALCCSTPILVLFLSAIGLGALTAYLDYILLPILAGFIILTIYGLFNVLRTRR
jgi:mercuric ion transport protein